MRPLLRTIAVTAALLASAVSPASAQDDGVFVDPDSPSGKEYQIPLESVRRQANPATRPGTKVAPGERSSPLFGEGIEPERDGSAAGGSGKGSSGGSGGSGSGGSGSSSGSGASVPGLGTSSPDTSTLPSAARPGAPEGGAGTTLLVLGGAAAVLLLGGAAGYAMRRRPAASA